MPKKLSWFTRRDGVVKGPFPAGLITNHILLGRIRETDEVSTDGEIWHPVKETPELYPEVMKVDLNDPIAQERFLAARRWADERSRDRRKGETPPPEVLQNRRITDRREPESEEIVQRRLARSGRLFGTKASSTREKRIFFAFTGVLVIFMLIAAYFYASQQEAEVQSQCNAAPRPGIDWTNCSKEGVSLEGQNLEGARLFSANFTGAKLKGADLSGSDLSYALLSIADLKEAELHGAKLLGTSLRGADLSRARLEGANLAYANLTGAIVTDANFKDVRLDNAVWTDGKKCQPGSVGTCIPVP